MNSQLSVSYGRGASVMSDTERDNEWFWRHDHPLLNNLVLSTVFKYLRSKKDLKKCRLVCKAWNVSTIPYSRDLCRVTLYHNKPPWCDNGTGKGSIKKFMKVFGSNQLGIPFARFSLGAFSTTDGVGQEFLQLCGHVIKEIGFILEDYIVQDLSEILKSAPKLEIFTIPDDVRSRAGNIVKLFPEDSKPKLTSLNELNVTNDNREERNRFCPTFLEELIISAENIERIIISDTYTSLDEDTEEELNLGSSVETLSLIEKLGRESSVQKLYLGHAMRDDCEYFEVLRKMTLKPDGLKLKTFHYEVTAKDQGTHRLIQLVSLFKDTLEDLKIEGNLSARFTEFLKMSHLARLSIQVSDNFNSEFANLNEIFPVLKTLELNRISKYNCYSPKCEFVEFFPQSDPCPKMNSFVSYIEFRINGFNQMLTVFPNVTILSLEVGEDGEQILRQLWSRMTQLKQLKIKGHMKSIDSLDSVLTGISTEELQEIGDDVRDVEKFQTEFERRETIEKIRCQHSQHPSIVNLRQLISLDLSISGGRNACGPGTFVFPGPDPYIDYNKQTLLTDLTGYLAFYSMKCLRDLNVRRSQFTTTCCETLIKDMKLESWTFRTWDNWDGENINSSE